ncbi:MAG TPA: hypothetical protein HPP66_01465 [Planctomycetes bacterium]|nr:hypothetical protein [Planctomycetota bacterium]
MNTECSTTNIEDPAFLGRNHSSIINNHLVGSSTTVESALQIAHFMQNKPNFQNAQMNVSRVSTKDYAKWTLGQRGKNKPNTNPIKPNFPAPRGETNPIQTQSNPISPPHAAKQTQYKPNQTQFQTRCTLALDFYFTSLSSRVSSVPCNLCSSKRWPTYSAAFVWSLVVFFAFFVETAVFNFFLLDFAISLQSPY